MGHGDIKAERFLAQELGGWRYPSETGWPGQRITGGRQLLTCDSLNLSLHLLKLLPGSIPPSASQLCVEPRRAVLIRWPVNSDPFILNWALEGAVMNFVALPKITSSSPKSLLCKIRHKGQYSEMGFSKGQSNRVAQHKIMPWCQDKRKGENRIVNNLRKL